MQYKDVLKKAKDTRTVEELKQNIEMHNKLTLLALIGLKTWYRWEKGLDLEIIQHKEYLFTSDEDLKEKSPSDATIYLGDKQVELEVKVTAFEFHNPIEARSYTIKKLAPNGYLYLSDDRRFTLIPCKHLVKQKEYTSKERGGEKKVYRLNKDKIKWQSHIAGLGLKEARNKYKTKKHAYRTM